MHTYIFEQKAIKIDYQSFNNQRSVEYHFHPWYLKEYRNRWYLFGVRANDVGTIVNLALDRIQEIRWLENVEYVKDESFDLEEYLKPIVGVTMLNVPYETVSFVAKKETIPYIETKPLHFSQTKYLAENGQTVFTLRVKVNFELEKDLLSFDEQITILSPISLREKMSKRLSEAIEKYK